jgi:hypothetical protein
LEADAAVNTGGKVNPVPISTFDIFTGTWMNASNWAGINAISDTLAGISNNSVWHSAFS